MIRIFLSLIISVSTFLAIPTVAKENPVNYKMKLSDPLPANLFSELAKKINPAVVSISVSINYRSRIPRGMYRDPFWDFFEQFMQPGQPPVPEGPQDPKKHQPVGTGFIIESDGVILTNYHVIEIADTVFVHLENDSNKSYEAKIIGGDKRTDIAILKIDTAKKLPTVELGSSEDVKVGEWVAAFGNPYGHEFSMSKGIISAKGRKIRDLNVVPFLQTDASINPGNSGGPLVDSSGKVIGVNTAIDARAQGIGFAIPIDHVKSILPQLKKFGKVVRGYIGVQIDNISPRAQAVLGLPSTQGALILGILNGSPADKSGLKAYDVITKFEGKKISSAQDFSDAVKAYPIGKKAKVEVIRQGKKRNLSILVDNPPDENRPLRVTKKTTKKGDEAPFSLGFKVVDYSSSIAKELGINPKSPKAPIVVEVESGSPAAQNGLKVGDIILDVNKKPVKSAKDVISNLKKGSNILRVQNKTQVSLIFLDI